MSLKLKPDSTSSPGAPFSWDTLPTSPSVASPSEPPLSPPTLWLDAKQMRIFGAEPLRPEFGVVRCKDCDKPIQKSAFADHVERCRTIRAGGKKGSAKVDDKKGKKRKADDNDTIEDEGGVKKKKPATKITKGRLKGPVDLDRQCGVINDKGLPCSRALTCKSHSMGAKRAVQGRSKKYDELLSDFNKERNPNYVEPPKRQTKAERKEKKEKEKAEKKRLAVEAAAVSAAVKQTTGGLQKKKKTTTTAAPVATVPQDDDEDENMDDVDSEAELDSMVKAVRNAQTTGVIGVPLAVPCDAGSWFVGRRERLRNCRDLIASALMPRGAMNGTMNGPMTSVMNGTMNGNVGGAPARLPP
ncbi:SCA7-domain-containing protein [Fomitiporia mediterranea MF3/22]|uniref:SCA7-domain-containing protein n=1 Tax=Fomitiporia mediterranea (strain MF3/22) TaxID=694068 RepID=UPI000440736E|nr:SCA7-domain-containing protein [Fomitiporia mediterranea MF3/22]EJD01532.1 SCA7-domain-containing protein [Fomitiporia mediterranea MF3/22]